MNSKRKGTYAIGASIAYFIANGITVLLPVSDCDKYDIAIDKDERLQKVQCKYTDDKEPSGAYIVDLRTFGGYRDKTYHTKYKEGDFDILFIYCSNKDKYLIPAHKIIGRSHISVGAKKWNEYKC